MQQLGQLFLETAHIGELEHRAAADCAPLSCHVLADRCGERDREAFALPKQPIDRGFKRHGLLGAQPRRVGEDSLCREVRGEYRGIADDLRPTAAVPGKDDLRLGQQEAQQPVDLSLEPRRFGPGPGALDAQAIVGAHQHHRGHDRKTYYAEEQRKTGQRVIVKVGQRFHVVAEHQRSAFLRESGTGEGKCGEDRTRGVNRGEGGEPWRRGGAEGERSRAVLPPAWSKARVRPDRVRHAAPHVLFRARPACAVRRNKPESESNGTPLPLSRIGAPQQTPMTRKNQPPSPDAFPSGKEPVRKASPASRNRQDNSAARITSNLVAMQAFPKESRS